MDWLDILYKLWPVLGLPLIWWFQYQQSQIRKIHERMDTMITKEEARVNLDSRIQFLKEKIDDTVQPLYEQLVRIESRLDKIYDRLDNRDS